MRLIYQKISAILLAILFVALPQHVLGQEAIQVSNESWDADFRENITFTLNAESSAEIVEVDLFYRVAGQLATSRNQVEFTPGTSIEAEFTIDQTEPSNYQPPGAELEYWWKIVDADGNEFKTDKQPLVYLDNHHDWQTLQNDRLTLYWYQGGDNFGEALFERADAALDTLERDIGIKLESPIKIFIYGGHDDLLNAIRVGSQEWTGGQAFTTHGIVVIGIHPSQLDWGLNATTHEMTHLVIHQATDNPFSGLPRWLDEGIAVFNENRDELDVDFRGSFDQAVENNQLMTLRTLSSPFPASSLEANLAYGQSGAVVRYIVDTYGSEAMAELLSIFAEGALYDEALEQALGVDTDTLDSEFRISLGLPPLPGFEPSEQAEPEIDVVEEAATELPEIAVAEETNSEDASAAPVEAVEEAAPDAAATDVPVQPEAESESAAAAPATTDRGTTAAAPACAAGMIALFIMGGTMFMWRRV